MVTPGNYKFLVGASSRDIKATLEAEVAAATQKTNNILKLQEPIEPLEEMRVGLSEKITNHHHKKHPVVPFGMAGCSYLCASYKQIVQLL